MKYIICCALLTLSISLSAQQCPCLSKFKQVKKTVELEYQYFDKKVNHFGKDEYLIMTNEITNDILQLDGYIGCFETINAWLYYFRDENLKLQIQNKTITFELS